MKATSLYLAILLTAITLTYSVPYANTTTPPQSAIASAASQATDAGFAMLQQGGNAFDAAIAVASTLGVVEPYNSGLGGGGFWLLYRAKDNYTIVIDGRETAPQKADPAYYIDKQGVPINRATLDGPLAAAIPGEPASLVYLATHFGLLPLSQSLLPAITLAEQGFHVDKRYQQFASLRQQALILSPAASALFLAQDQVPPLGYLIKQPALAKVLKQIAKNGLAGFYTGETAQLLVDGVVAHGGIWQLDDLKNYQIKLRLPLTATYRTMKITTTPPPSAGGIAIIEMLNILSNYDLTQENSLTTTQLTIEAMRRAYRDRTLYLGDPDFTDIPLSTLLSLKHARILASTMIKNRATSSASLNSPQIEIKEKDHTTHFSIIDQEGNRVAATLSLNNLFGSGFVAPHTGILLNDQIDDFSMAVGTANLYGITGSQANLIAPQKRPLSSIAPTFVETTDGVAILGTPGGSRIPSMLVLAILDFAQGHPPSSWVSLPRYHHQYLPDQIQFEMNTFNAQQQMALYQMGYALDTIWRPYGDMQAILWDKQHNQVLAASDPRQQGKALVMTVKKQDYIKDWP